MSSGPAVVLTREREDNERLSRELRLRGIPVLEIPCMETRYVDSVELPREVDAVVFTSRRGVKGLLRIKGHERLLAGRPARGDSAVEDPATGDAATGDPTPMKPVPLLCAVGEGTAKALALEGCRPDLVAEPPEGSVLAALLVRNLPASSRVAVVRGNLHAGGLDEALARAGFGISVIQVYENHAPPIPALARQPVAAVFMAAPSAARRLLEANPWLRESPFFTLGGTTAGALRALGIRSVVVTGPLYSDWLDALRAAHARALRLVPSAWGNRDGNS